jgi:hypothetical protein
MEHTGKKGIKCMCNGLGIHCSPPVCLGACQINLVLLFCVIVKRSLGYGHIGWQLEPARSGH